MYVYINVYAQYIYNTYAYQPRQIFMKMVLFGCANSSFGAMRLATARPVGALACTSEAM